MKKLASLFKLKNICHTYEYAIKQKRLLLFSKKVVSGTAISTLFLQQMSIETEKA